MSIKIHKKSLMALILVLILLSGNTIILAYVTPLLYIVGLFSVLWFEPKKLKANRYTKRIMFLYFISPVFFGEEFTACGDIIKFLSVTVFFIAWANVIRTQYLIPNKRDSIYLISTTIGAVLNLLINWMLIPKYQANGAALGTIVAEFSVMFVQMVAVRKEIAIRKYIMSYCPIMIIGVIMAVLVGWMGYEFGVNIVTLVLQILIGGGFFCLATMGYMLISKDELWTIGISSILKKKK